MPGNTNNENNCSSSSYPAGPRQHTGATGGEEDASRRTTFPIGSSTSRTAETASNRSSSLSQEDSGPPRDASSFNGAASLLEWNNHSLLLRPAVESMAVASPPSLSSLSTNGLGQQENRGGMMDDHSAARMISPVLHDHAPRQEQGRPPSRNHHQTLRQHLLLDAVDSVERILSDGWEEEVLLASADEAYFAANTTSRGTGTAQFFFDRQ
jgi:hypothetical protein